MFWNQNKKNFSPKKTDIGLIVQKLNSIIYKFINETHLSIKIDKYLMHIENISSQKENTNAEELHKFIINHPEYKKNSEINYKISDDLIEKIINDNT